MFPKVPFSLKIILSVDRTDLAAFIFHSLRVRVKRKRGLVFGGIWWIQTCEPPERYQNCGIQVSVWPVSHMPQGHRDSALCSDSELTSSFLTINTVFQLH